MSDTESIVASPQPEAAEKVDPIALADRIAGAKNPALAAVLAFGLMGGGSLLTWAAQEYVEPFVLAALVEHNGDTDAHAAWRAKHNGDPSAHPAAIHSLETRIDALERKIDDQTEDLNKIAIGIAVLQAKRAPQ